MSADVVPAPARQSGLSNSICLVGLMKGKCMRSWTLVTRKKGVVGAAVLGLILPLVVSQLAFADGVVDVSVTGNADGSLVGVSGTGNSYSSGGIAIAGTGTATGGVASGTVAGEAHGGMVEADPDERVGGANTTAWDTLRSNDIYSNMGLNYHESAYQSWLIATYPQPDAGQLAQKRLDYAENARLLADHIASAGSPTASRSMAAGFPEVDAAPRSGLIQRGPTCGAAATYATYAHRGMPSYEELVREMGNDEAGGVSIMTMWRTITRHYNGPTEPDVGRLDDPLDLLIKAKTAIDDDQGMIVAVSVQHLPWWQRADGVPRVGRHALSVTGYIFHPREIMTTWMQTWDSAVGRWQSSDGLGGPHNITLDSLYFAATAGTDERQLKVIW